MNEHKDYFKRTALELFVMLMWAEGVFRLLSFSLWSVATVRIVLFTAAAALFITAVCGFLPEKIRRTAVYVIAWIIACFTVVELTMIHYLGNYTSIRGGTGMIGRVLSFAPSFIKAIKPVSWTVLLAPLVLTVYSLIKRQALKADRKTLLWGLAGAVFLDLCGLYTVWGEGVTQPYRYPRFIGQALNEFGVGRFLLRDLMTLTKDEEYELVIDAGEDTDPAEETIPEDTEESHRIIDDTEWRAASEAEENENIKQLDQWFLSRTVADYNEMTGALRGKNLIYIMIEAFDYMALDPELTPTMWMMKEEGFDFTHHYTPKYSCTTGESEFISLYSLIPESDVCTPNQYRNNDFSEGIFNLFRNQGYATAAFHNWKDEFYERRTLYGNSGCEVYLNYNDVQYTRLFGWPSDYELFEKTMPEYMDEDRFMVLYVTSSMHFPYDADSALGNKYLDEINALHPDYPINVKRYISKAMELDRGFRLLLDTLEEKGILEDTAIVFFADHHPLNTPLSTIADYTTAVDKREGMNMDRTPFVLYAPALGAKKLDEVNSTFDILPTVLNLYDLDYDPRLYLGNDYFDEKEKVVYFTDGSWLSETGEYYASYGQFVPYGEDPGEEYVSRMNNEVQTMFRVSSMVFRNDYFRSRDFVVVPDDSLEDN